jgi:hypothetical protein
VRPPLHDQDPQQRHELDRTAVREVVCALCEKRQPIAETCYACGVEFGEYRCLRCSFYDDDVTKQQFHCEKCGICRVGGQENYFHCDKCAACYHNQLQVRHAGARGSPQGRPAGCSSRMPYAPVPVWMAHRMHAWRRRAPGSQAPYAQHA